jgi:hypothetical protein
MLITGKHIPRRAFLRDVGVTIALPFLESMVPARARAAVLAPKTRFAALFLLTAGLRLFGRQSYGRSRRRGN